MANVTLTPIAQSYGNALSKNSATASFSVPTTQGSLSDGSDATYTALAAVTTTDNVVHVDTVSCDFVLGSSQGTNPTAVYLQIRARNDADVLANPPIGGRQFWVQLSAVTDGTIFGYNNTPTPAVQPLLDPSASTMTEFDFWWGGAPDPANPTDPGGWFEFGADALADGSAAALTGAGMRATVGFYWSNQSDGIKRTWVDLAEMRLVVATGPAASGYAPLCRKWPVPLGRHWPPQSAQQLSARRAGGYY